jgi:hypothetical protein
MQQRENRSLNLRTLSISGSAVKQGEFSLCSRTNRSDRAGRSCPGVERLHGRCAATQDLSIAGPGDNCCAARKNEAVRDKLLNQPGRGKGGLTLAMAGDQRPPRLAWGLLVRPDRAYSLA